MRDRFGIFGAVIRIRKLSLLLVVTLRMPNKGLPSSFHTPARSKSTSLRVRAPLQEGLRP
jgi:hypothetical protein